MANKRRSTGVVLLVVAAGLALFGILVHYSFTAVYGDITASGLDGAWSAFTDSPGPLVLALVVVASVAALLASPQPWARLAALGVPVLMVLGMLAVTPAALRDKREEQFAATPRCLFEDEAGASSDPETGKSEGGPWMAAAQDSQRAFDSIDHVGLFGGGGATGVGGCSQTLVAIGDVDFMQHYRTALPVAGWRVVGDAGGRIRAESDDMAFEVAVCDDGGAVWAGKVTDVGAGLCAEH